MLEVPKTQKRTLLPVALLVAWLIFTIAAFWWFQFRHISQFDAHFAAFNGEAFKSLNLSSESGKPLVVHLVDDGCACSRFATPHISDLEETFANDAEFVYWSPTDKRLEALSELAIPAGPAVAIWSANGELAYFGPYSSGYFCGEGEDFVQATISKLKIAENPSWINHDALGCFCPWQENT